MLVFLFRLWMDWWLFTQWADCCMVLRMLLLRLNGGLGLGRCAFGQGMLLVSLWWFWREGGCRILPVNGKMIYRLGLAVILGWFTMLSSFSDILTENHQIVERRWATSRYSKQFRTCLSGSSAVRISAPDTTEEKYSLQSNNHQNSCRHNYKPLRVIICQPSSLVIKQRRIQLC